MKYEDNIQQLLELAPDFMGFIFYPKSPRFVGAQWTGPGGDFSGKTKKVGVFVNESVEKICNTAARFGLDYLQLHGYESPQYCKTLSQENLAIIKAVRISTIKDIEGLADYVEWVDYFLFDTPGHQYGGTGKVFDWSILESYQYGVPVFLSGGISLDNLSSIKNLKDFNPEVIDVNSRFESAPGLKDISMLEQLKNQLKEL
jgi:phosphoribosylanthranilate isomerase